MNRTGMAARRWRMTGRICPVRGERRESVPDAVAAGMNASRRAAIAPADFRFVNGGIHP